MKWLADENLRNAVIRGLARRDASFDIIRAQDTPGVSRTSDDRLLEWAALDGRIVLTQDLATMLPARNAVLARGGRPAPVVIVPDTLSISEAIEAILLLDGCSTQEDWATGVIYLPLR